MIVIRYREDPTSAILTGAAIVLLIGSLAFMLLAPRPNAAAEQRKLGDRAFKAKVATEDAEKKIAAANAYVVSRTWAGNVEDVSPTALRRVTAIAKAHSLNLLSFRPQRSTDSGAAMQIPFQATVEGSYPAVVAFARDLETPSSRLVVSSIMISSTDASSDRVTATIALIAFTNPSSTPKPASGPPANSEKTNA